ncbi:MAG TPA: AMP-binding protein [Streptosporangiaceae bacterium]|jgi:amino acid adenylation domain-containing protein|nr:AMP-binding protein [Streptosporangiaceae bacterium]
MTMPTITRYPASAEQRRALAQMRITHSRAEEITRAFWLDGDVGTGALVRAITAVAARRDMLRAKLVVTGDTAVQEVHDQCAGVEIVPLPGGRAAFPAAAQAAAADPLTDRDTWFQATVFPADHGHGLLLRLHHSLVDGYSVGLVEEDLWAALDGTLRATDPPAFATRVTAREGGPAGEAWWREALRGCTPATVEPDVLRPGDALTVGSVPLDIPQDTAARVRALAAELRTTPLTVLLTAHLMTVAAFSGQDDVIAATPYLNRDAPGTRDLVGPLVNLLPIRATPTGPRLRDNVPAVAVGLRAALAHADVPYDRITAGSVHGGDGGYGPARTAIVLNPSPRPSVFDCGPLRVTLVELPSAGLRWDLVTTLQENNGALLYRADRYSAATARSVRDHFLAILADTHLDTPALPLPARPGAAVEGHLDRLRALLALEAFTDPAPVVRTGDTVLDRAAFLARVGAYQQVLRFLEERPRVALCLAAPAEQAAALLAVWRCAGTAVLLDPAHPAQRRETIARDAGVIAVLTEPPETAAEPASELAAEPAAVTPRRDGLAYLVYTSGTDGAPKGVEATYANIEHLLGVLAGLAMPGAGRNTLGPAFDGWLWATLLPWTTGHPVVFGGHADGVTLTPTMLAEHDPADLPGSVVSAGEPLARSLAERHTAGRRIVNAYGPTELTVCATWADSADGEDVVAIGRPVPGTRLYLLDRSLRPVPRGAVGEIVVAGPGVTRGYRSRPGPTARAYVPDPFAGDGSRMYRTGDLARLDADGLLYHVGRRDAQTKIAGVRVELDEIAAVAGSCPGVREAAAVLHGDVPEVWVAVVLDGPDVPVERVAEACAARLLPEMRPTRITPVHALPSTANGKLDRGALSATLAELAGPEPDVGDCATRALVAMIWKSVLGVEVDDHTKTFQELGGHSLRATVILSRLRQEYDFPIPARVLFDHPTVEALSRWLEARR